MSYYKFNIWLETDLANHALLAVRRQLDFVYSLNDN